jgi:hypothetical protein
VGASGGFSCASPDVEANDSAVASMHANARARAMRSLHQWTIGSPQAFFSQSLES